MRVKTVTQQHAGTAPLHRGLLVGSREAMWIIGFGSIKIKVPGLAECVLFKPYIRKS
jgi:hypothetical protein